MDGNIKDTPPIVVVPRPEDRPRWDALSKEIAAAQAAGRRPQAGGPRRLRQVARRRRSRADRRPGPDRRAAASTPPLSEGQGKTVNVDGRRQAASVDAGTAIRLGRRATSRRRRSSASRAAAVEVPDAGDFDKDQPFSVRRLGASCPSASIDRRGRRPHGRPDDYRGWDLWIENGRVGTHIVNKWPDDALKVVAQTPLKPNEWHHVCRHLRRLGQGRRREDLRQRRAAADRRRRPTRSRARSSTTVPFKIGQRSTTSRLDGVAIQDVRHLRPRR